MSIYGVSGSVACPANAVTQLLGIVASSTADGDIVWFDVTFDAAVTTYPKVELFRATGGIPTLTQVTNANVTKENAKAQNRVTQMASVWVSPITATPTGVTVTKTWFTAGGVLVQWPLGNESYIIPATTNWYGARVTTVAGVSANCAYNLSWRE